jgi:GNAT superfamily N-acetyltransferase
MHALDRLPAFPPAAALPDISERMRTQSVALRTAAVEDMPYLRDLFHAQKSEELSWGNLPEPLRQTLLDQQFTLQHTQYLHAHSGADFFIIEHQQQPIGRYYLLREPPCYHIIDILLAPEWRGRGIGGLLLDWTQSLAHQQHATGISLHVDESNSGAQRLYARHGFVEIARQSPSIAMRWDASIQLNTA